MADVIAVGSMVLFFAVAALFVLACDKIIGSDEEALAEEFGAQPGSPPERVAA